MDWPLLVFLLLSGYLAWRGYRAGLLRSVSRLCSLVAGYGAAFLFTRSLAKPVEAWTGLEGIAALLAASLALFAGAALAVALAFRAAASWLRGARGPTALGRGAGAAVGLVNGVLLSILVIWAGGFVHDLYRASEHAAGPTNDPAGEAAPTAPATPSRTAEWVDRAAGFALDKALEAGDVDPDVAAVGSALIRSPDRILGVAMRLAHSPELAALLGDPRNHPTLDSGDLDALQGLPAFQRLAAQPDMRMLLTALRLAEDDDEAGRAAILAARVSDVWLRTRAVERDPRVLRILDDADFRANLAAGNPLALVNDAQLLELVQVVMSAEPAAITPGSSADGRAATTSPGDGIADEQRPADREAAKIYRWRDASGRLIYSDEPPPQR